MLIETLDNKRTYLKATLMKCLKEASSEQSPIPWTYKSILRREKAGIRVYNKVRRDPGTTYRMYTGKLIREIVDYEIHRAIGKQKIV